MLEGHLEDYAWRPKKFHGIKHFDYNYQNHMLKINIFRAQKTKETNLFEFELAATFRVPLGDKLIAGGIIID